MNEEKSANMTSDKKTLSLEKILAMIFIVASVILAIVSFVVLPDSVRVQFAVGNSTPTTLPKILAIAISAVLSAGFAIAALVSKKDQRENRKMLIVAVLGIGSYILTILVNM